MHPTQLYQVALITVFFLIIWKMRKHRHREGWLFGVYLVLAGVERFLVEFVRAKDDLLSFGLTIAQVISIGAMLAGIAWLVAFRKPRATAA